MSKLGRSIDELDIDGFELFPGTVLHGTLSKNESTLLDSDATSLEHNPVLVDLTIVRKSTHGSNSLLGKIRSGTAGCSISLLSNTVHLFVELGTVEITVLTSTWNGSRNTCRMPRSNTSHLTKTTVSLTGKTRNSPTSGNSLESLSFGDSNHIHILILGKDRVNGDFFLKQRLGKVNLGLGVSSTVNLDLHDVSLFQTKIEFLNL
mmetsp:Transcript_9760/g.18348  ORF Transcript_9760/g.18348 Transcript_9760/m.18348 type:complete len:205 (-) Transcript_9760:695-1309(-)